MTFIKWNNPEGKINLVGGEGPKRCLMALIGEAPGAEEERMGRPFIGTAGALLNQKLHLCGIARQECYVTNLVKVRPPDNDFSIYWQGKTPKRELLEWRDSLLQELSTLDTNIIVPLGNNALWALTGHTQIGKWRGSLLSTDLNGRKMKVLPTYHPAAVLREWTLGTVMQFDFMKAKKEAEFPRLQIPKRILHIEPTYSDVIGIYNTLKDVAEISFDIETSPSGIECISLSHKSDWAISIPTTTFYWKSMTQLKSILDGLCFLMQNKSIKVGQNITFDIQYLLRYFAILPSKPWFDTMISQHSCYSELPKSLAFLASVYTNEPYYKDDLKIWRSDMSNNKKLWEYNARDAAVTLEIKHELDQEMDELGTRPTFNFAMELLEPLLFMMMKGISVDHDAIKLHREQYKEKVEGLEATFKEKFGDVNPRSSKQMMELAYKTLALNPVMKKGRPTADKKAIEKLAIKSPDIAIAADIRSEKTIVSNYLGMSLDIDGRLHCSFNSTGTETRRLSSSESVFGSGRNLQNLPKKIRNIIVSDPGKTLIEADLSGAESRVVAYLSEDPIGIKVFESGKNIHTSTACMLFAMTPEEVKADKEKCDTEGRDTEAKYFIAKKLRHSVEKYGSWVTISEQLRVSASKAKELIERFYMNNPNLQMWFRQIESNLKRDRTIITPFGDKRIFFGRFGHQTVKEAVAHVAQDTVGKIINTGIIKVYNTLCKDYPDLEILLQVHDALVCQCNDENVKAICQQLPTLLKLEVPYRSGKFTIPVDLKTGKNWRDMEEFKVE